MKLPPCGEFQSRMNLVMSYNNIIFIDKLILFYKQYLFVMLMREQIFYQAREKLTERAEQIQHNGNFTEATSAEIKHDLVCARK